MIVFLRDVKHVLGGESMIKLGRLSKYFSGKKTEKPEHAYVIVYGPTAEEQIDVICDSQSEFNANICLLNYLIRESRMAYDRDPTKLLILKHWMKADANNDGQLDYKEVAKLCQKLNIDMSSKSMKQ